VAGDGVADGRCIQALDRKAPSLGRMHDAAAPAGQPGGESSRWRGSIQASGKSTSSRYLTWLASPGYDQHYRRKTIGEAGISVGWG
jgi:hypothetical protein